MLIDVNLLAGVLVAGVRLWTLDRRLQRIAHELDVGGGPV